MNIGVGMMILQTIERVIAIFYRLSANSDSLKQELLPINCKIEYDDAWPGRSISRDCHNVYMSLRQRLDYEPIIKTIDESKVDILIVVTLIGVILLSVLKRKTASF
jgi:hypothetical protein